MERYDLLFIEITSVILFILGIFHFKKRSTGRMVEFVMIAAYGFILEELNMQIFKSYHYSPDFQLTFFKLPVSIALLWAIILAGAMEITDRLGLPSWSKPFFDAILAVWIDLSLDAVAIRLEYWTWIIPLNEGWFGVPAGNLYAWMWVAFAYSILARWVRKKTEDNPKWIWAYLPMPIFAYVILFISMTGVGVFGRIAGLETQNQRLVVFALQFIAFTYIVLRAWPQREKLVSEVKHSLALWKWSRYFMHLYFLIAYFIIGTHREMPVLGVIAAVVFIGEIIFFNKLLQEKQLVKEKI